MLERKVYSPEGISVVVRAHNEQRLVLDALEGLRKSGIDPSCDEVILVNNESTDDTRRLVVEFLADHGIGKVVDEPRKGRVAALQRGVLEARGGIIAVTDADSVVINQWANRVRRTMEDPQIIAASGKIRFRKGPFSLAHHDFFYQLVRGVIFSTAAQLPGKALGSGANMWFRSSLKEEIERLPNKVLVYGELVELTVEDRVLFLNIGDRAMADSNLGRIGYFPRVMVETDNWLVQKPNWLSQLDWEMEMVRAARGVSPSLFHLLIKPVSSLLTSADQAGLTRVKRGQT